ncbi:MAG: hypothetical protein JSW66_11490 [Phycisphaerales bacterium]|nr:MAG: hypothetical protein JSW66_11490 [Phycisphaerales bacterium]
MTTTLSAKDIRALKIGAVGAVAILVFFFGSKWQDRWAQARAGRAELEAKLDAINVDKARATTVPLFEMPKTEDEQKFLFRDKLTEQLKRAGIRNEPLQLLPAKRSSVPGYKLLLVKCSAKCRFSQALDLLARLNENPYLAGIEEFRIKVDPKKRENVDLDLTVSTFAK